MAHYSREKTEKSTETNYSGLFVIDLVSGLLKTNELHASQFEIMVESYCIWQWISVSRHLTVIQLNTKVQLMGEAKLVFLSFETKYSTPKMGSYIKLKLLKSYI